MRVTDPRTGLARRLKWLPTIAEVAEACDAEMRPLLVAETQRRRAAEYEADKPQTYSEVVIAHRKQFIAGWRNRSAVADEKTVDPLKAQRELRDLCAVHGVDPDSLADRPGMRSPKSLGAVASNLKG